MKNRIPSEPTMSDWDSIRSEAESGNGCRRIFRLEIIGHRSFRYIHNEWHKLTELLKFFDKFIERLKNGLKSDSLTALSFWIQKLAIPSITGRSGSNRFVWSFYCRSLSSDSKLDVIDKVDGHTDKTKLGCTLSADVQIQTSSHKPNMKVVSRMHVDMNVGAKIVRKERTCFSALLTPSENLLHVKISNSIVKTDEHHQEIPVFGKPHRKIESCYDGLHKPLGSYRVHHKQMHGNLVIVGNSKRLFNINVTHETSSLGSKESHKVSVTVFVKDNMVYGMNCSLNKTTGIKEHLSFEVKTHHGLIVKGACTKEGYIGFSENKEGKLSCEFSIIAPSGVYHMRKTIERRRYKKSHAISTKSVIEYQPTGGEKQSITCLGTVQKKAQEKLTRKLNVSQHIQKPIGL
ncbi:hypothetical protein CEXT_293011 [Caerostris extrusa]|uniref:Uncharacterized protein n=1 Tax=Caerostris extrusa TaxID=172846 RepID=A0AAV4W2I9_CAEEX|nr:hypothetical protein CEXT_293011 [Caerostris extrusa]